ncbi:peptide ABC transporter permease [Kaistia sp. 32K]|uniref:ABC transporter permease n=1 Tax=Kaistia sp. 32K TaxID=2795690 RepID=UPI001915ECD3|nr:ABC transporter permease [Kaistia sp. 32K]BCP55546.1 peptide ABC transporter permease [Kaistia sp. 32K]
MLRYTLRRAAHALLVLWATYTATFFLLFVLPGDRVFSKLGAESGGAGFNQEAVDRLRAEMGLDQPALVQYGRALWQALHGDFGVSAQTGGDALRVFAAGVPETLKLAGVALVFALAFGFALALLAVQVRWKPLADFLLSVPALAVSVPSFWIGLLLLQVVSFQWNLLPGLGNDGFQSLILPGIVLAIPAGAVIAQVLIRGLTTALSGAYVDTARARGASRRHILFHHALRNALVPVVTAMGTTSGYLIAGSVVAETVFSRSGIGLITVKAVTYQDTPVVLVAVLFAALVYVTVNFLVDLVYPLIDPRIDIGSGRASHSVGTVR